MVKCSSWGRCVRQTDSSLQTDCRRFSSTRPCRRTLTVSVSAPRRRPQEGPAAHAAMLKMNNTTDSYVRSFVPHRWAAAVRSAAAVCHAVWNCSRTISGAVHIAVDTTCRPRMKGHHPDIGRVTSRAVHRRPAASRRRLSWRWSVGRIGNA